MLNLLFLAATVTVGEMEMKTYPFGDPDPVPATAQRRYPYFRYDKTSLEGTPAKWKTVTLENEAIRVVLLPQVGGKVWTAVDKKTGRDFLFANHVMKFRDIALRGPWTAGGIEFNFGIIGHAPSSGTPADWYARTNADGSASCFVASCEYITRTWWQVEVRLKEGAEEFETHVTWYNASGLPAPYYHWMNAAYSVSHDPEFLFPGKDVIGHQGEVETRDWPVMTSNGRRVDDMPGNAWGGPKSYHVLPGNNGFYGIWWRELGFGSYHRSEPYEKYGRKIWLQTMSPYGLLWVKFKTDDDGQNAELQSGRCFNQPRFDTYKTPFKHQVFAPGSTETFAEHWGPIRDRSEVAEDMRADRPMPKARPVEAPADFDWNSAWGEYVRGSQALAEHYEALGRQHLEAAIRKDRFLSPAYSALAGAEFRRGDYARVHALCEKALAINTYDPLANYLDGFAFFVEGDQVTARERLGLAAQTPQYRAPALALIARSYLCEGRAEDAATAARKALKANDTNIDALLALAIAQRGEPADVRKAYLTDVLGRLPLAHAFRYELALVDPSVDAASLVSNELPAETWLELGSWYAETGLADDARHLFDRAGASAIAYLRKGDWRAAKALAAGGVFPFRRETLPALEKAVREDGHWKFRYWLAAPLAFFGYEARAKELLESCGSEPDDPVFYQYRAALRKDESLLADLDRAQALGDSWRIGRQYLDYYEAKGNWTKVLEIAGAYVAKFPGRDSISLSYARALQRLGRNRECMEYLSTLQLLPSEYGGFGTDIWHAAQDALGQKRTWPENLGKGEPYPDVQEAARLFPFDIEGDGLVPPDTNATPAGASGFIAARGQQFVDAKGTARRFLGVNLYGPAQMPTKADAEKTARQLAGWGFTAVRLFPQYTCQLREDKDYAKGPDPELLDRFDYFFAQLKARGIYATMNLHSARTAGYRFKGFRQTMKENKGLDNFDPTFIRHQKEWAAFVFDHVNPYTGLAYRDEPAVLSWEINNECSLAITWFQWDLWNQMLPPFKSELSRQFSDWAERKYGTMEKLRTAWAASVPTRPALPSADVWRDPSAFARAPWYTESWLRGGAGPKAYRLDANAGSVVVDAQTIRKFALIKVPFDAGEPYTVRFRIRSPQAGLAIFKVSQHERPYAYQGVQEKVKTGPDWTDVSLKGVASVADACNRVQFEFKRKGTYEIAALALVRGGEGGLDGSESFAAKNIAPVANASHARGEDVKTFILDVEERYWKDMIGFVKDVLKSRQLVCGGTLDYGAEYPQTLGDFLDNHHYYGGLASFPGKPWDRANWYTPSRLLVRNLDDGKASQSFAIRVFGKPYTVSEASMMHQIATAADFYPIYLSLAAFQDFAAVHTYTWTHRTDHRYGSTMFLNMRNNAKYLAHLPAARNMFVRGDVASGFAEAERIVCDLSRDTERALIAQTGYSRRSNLLDTDPLAMVRAATGIRFAGTPADPATAAARAAPEGRAVSAPRRAVSSTGEILWDATDAGRECYAVDTPRTKFLSQFGPAGTAHAFRDGTVFTLGETVMGWAALSLTETAPRRFLLAATGRMQPTGAKVTDYATKKPVAPADEIKMDGGKISTMTAMGDVPFVCEGVRATVRLPVSPGARVRVTPLDGNAMPKGEAMELTPQDGFVTFTIGEQYKTVWYRIEVAPTPQMVPCRSSSSPTPRTATGGNWSAMVRFRSSRR